MVRVFQTFASERQLRKLVGGNFEIKSAKDYAPHPGDLDYLEPISKLRAGVDPL
jgi:hypothetical protein